MIVEQSIVLAGKANRSKAFAPIILKEKKKFRCTSKRFANMVLYLVRTYIWIFILIFISNSMQMLTACFRKVG